MNDLEKATELYTWAYRIYAEPTLDEHTDKVKLEADYQAFLRAGARLEGIPLETLKRVRGEDVGAVLVAQERAARLRPSPKRGRGRPNSGRHGWITGTIEAYIGAGLSRKDAIARAAEQWKLAPSSVDEIYKDNKLKLDKSEAVRSLFHTNAPEEIDAWILLARKAMR